MHRIFTGTSLEAHCQRIKSSYASDIRSLNRELISSYIISLLAISAFTTLFLLK